VDNSLTHILQHKIIAIIRGANPHDVSRIVEALYAGGIRTLEITLNSPNALELISEVSTVWQNKMLVGAGTVLDAASANAAINAGAQFIISPIVDIATIRATKERAVISIPGAYTATEIVHAFSNGGDIIKVFPASVGPAYFKDLRGPLPHIPLMPTGGVQLDNIQAFQNAGAVAFGIGTALVDSKEKITDAYLQLLTTKATQFVQALQ
jgi:2-dehydro-3-deoxyphosphogluconate aldolase/(4S)-4-hydroxy-2-oxoglutarate aldolase